MERGRWVGGVGGRAGLVARWGRGGQGRADGGLGSGMMRMGGEFTLIGKWRNVV